MGLTVLAGLAAYGGGCLWLFVRAARRAGAGWRWGLVLPALVLAIPVSRIAWDVARDPTSHNLWPFELALWLPGALLVGEAAGLLARAPLDPPSPRPER